MGERVKAALKDDREIVQAAVQQDGTALQYASKAGVIAVMQQDGKLLRFASDEQKGDREIVQAAVQQDGTALQYASEAVVKHSKWRPSGTFVIGAGFGDLP